MFMNESAEIICIGTELLLGEILNSNAQFLAQELAKLGIPHFFQTVVGDNPVRIKQAIAIACQRSGLLIFTGGLGPTPDDLTTEAIADFFETPLIEAPEIWAEIQRRFAERKVALSPSNLKQALFPKGAQVLPNPTGTAPGMIWQPRAGITLLTFPGVPRELYRMWADTAIPFLQTQGWGTSQIYSKTLRFWGVSESGLAETVSDFLQQSDPTVAPYASRGETRLRISTRAASAAQAQPVLATAEQAIRKRVGRACYGTDQDSLASVVGNLLSQRQETLAVAESCTGGGLGQRITEVAGSSRYFHGGVIAYANSVKINLLKVEAEGLETQGAVSGSVAEQMALGVKECLGTTWGLGITGIAGPEGGSIEKPIGLVFIGIAGPPGVTHQEYRFGDRRGRDWIRDLSISHALDLLRRQLLDSSKDFVL
jgi:nicotinamide-nucleotide amidase